MKIRKSLFSLLILGVAIVPALPAHAMSWGGDVFGAFSTHTMGDLNDAIDAGNFGNADNVNSSLGGGIGIRLVPNPSWMFEGTWEPLFPSTKDDLSGNEIKLTANSFQATGTYFFPSAGKSKFGLGAGLGFYSLNGTQENSPNPDIDLGGSGVGFHILGTAEHEVSPGFGLFGSAGYRLAKISDTEFDGQGTSPKSETDFSGMTVRAGLAFYMVPSK